MFNSSKKRHRFRIVIPAYPAFNIYSGIANKTTALGPVCIASVINEAEKIAAREYCSVHGLWRGL